MIEGFHRGLKEEDSWLNEYLSLEEAKQSIGLSKTSGRQYDPHGSTDRRR